MPGFDFTNAMLTEWNTSVPRWNVFMLDASWDHGRFLCHLSWVESFQPEGRVFHLSRMSCNPVFAILVEDEAFATKLWERASYLPDRIGHLIIKDSDWIASWRSNEPYGDSYDDREMIHYVLCCGADFVHLLSKDPPTFEDLGQFTDEQLTAIKGLSELQLTRYDIATRH